MTYKSGTFEKTPDFVRHTQSLKCLWIGDSNKLLDAKRTIIGGRLCITPYKSGRKVYGDPKIPMCARVNISDQRKWNG